jgi:hypothetical protein
MQIKRAVLALPLVLAVLGSPVEARAQADEPRRLTADEFESYQMGMQLIFACSPYRHRRAQGSESTIRRESDALTGTAIHFSSVEGTYLVLEQYDEELNGHCLVIGWFGGALEPGRHAVASLAMGAVEAEVDSGDYSFYSVSLVRNAEENTVLVADSGMLEITAMEDGQVTGTFTVSGFLSDSNGATRTGEATWSGSFVAVRGAD